MSRPRTLAVTVIRRWPHSRVIVDGPSTILMSASRDSGSRSPAAVGTRIEPIASGAAPHVVGQPDHQREPQLPFDHFAQRLAADRFDDVGHDFGRHAVPGELLLLRA